MTNTDQTMTEPDLVGDAVREGDASAEPEQPAPEVQEPAAVDPASADEGAARDQADDRDQAEDGDQADDGDDDEDNPLEVEAEVAADYLEELLDIADLDGDIDTYIDGDRAHVSIVSESNALVGKDGQVLDALQELTRLAVLAETGQRSRLMLDVAGYRGKRRTELVALAGDAVQEVKDSGEPTHLKAMNPFERKIVHDAVAAAGLTSESEGEEPRRHVVVLPARG
jgi:spoIIIJ-associated protein